MTTLPVRAFAVCCTLAFASCAGDAFAPAETCNADGPAIERGGGGFLDGGEVTMTLDVRQPGRTTANFAEPGTDNEVTVTFPVDEPVPQPPGPVALDVGFGDCFGEGCDDQLWIVDEDGARLLEVGRVNMLDDGRVSSPFESPRFGLDFVGANDGCVAFTVDTDDGEIAMAPGESRLVTIDGAEWRAIAGAAGRTSFTQGTEPCADCAAPGTHTNTFASGVLYRLGLP